MSNIIKSNYIFYNKSDKVIIDSNGRAGNFGPLSLIKVINNEQPETADIEESAVLEKERTEEEESPLKEKMEILASQMMEQARVQADEIRKAAEEEAATLKAAAFDEGKKQGYEAGSKEAIQEFMQKKQELEEQKKRQDEEYVNQVKELEPKFADLTLKLVEKMTGIIAEDKRDLILYQISEAIKPIRGPKQFLIRVSKDDASLVIQKKDELASLLAADCSLEILEDASLEKNQCFIETEDRLLDVSLDVELKNLADHFRILACL